MESIATREAYGNALAKLGTRDDIIVLDADLSQSTKTIEFQKVNPSHFFNVGIAEQNLMGIAAGIATTGKIPFASTFAIFAAGRGFEVIRNSIAYPKLNVKIVATHSGLTVGEDGGSHEAIEDISIMRSIPNMTVIVPADGIETEKVIEAIVEYNGPVYVRLGRPKIPVLFENDYKFEIGKHPILKTGDSVTIVACGIMVAKALKVAEKLTAEGINAEVINASTIKPFDDETLLASVKKTGCVVTAEEHSILGGLGGAVCELLAREYPVPVVSIGVQDVFGESGSPDALLEKYGLTEKCIYEGTMKALMKKQGRRGRD
ncbi:transketolase [endosymbiont 'TC1' of Trimyema compressum]|uniref:transketolase family protein n=1 Tax=endosymbiont 'TC1' of Trimyema compressum TaxID=243899 RepID=UPI0007F12528|nr:transketolase family protein [endosymbiont 'TC1' of Trimyema compressum]AMP21325.1 transketolase [endosymbiont 'TC1' of Trimyema compressum]